MDLDRDGDHQDVGGQRGPAVRALHSRVRQPMDAKNAPKTHQLFMYWCAKLSSPARQNDHARSTHVVLFVSPLTIGSFRNDLYWRT